MTNQDYAKQLEINELYSQLDEVNDSLRAMDQDPDCSEEYCALHAEWEDLIKKLKAHGETPGEFDTEGGEFEYWDDNDQDFDCDHNCSTSQSYAAYYDRDDLARENLRSGAWCEVQAAEFRMGA